MAKRHRSLIELSHDHHHGLALALRLRQGDNALLNDGWTHDKAEQARRARRFYDEDLVVHFKEEELVLFPVMVREIPHCAALVETLIAQHRQLEHLIREMGTLDPGTLGKQLVGFGELLEQHIRSEERSLFPLFEAGVSDALADNVTRDLARVRQEMKADRKQ